MIRFKKVSFQYNIDQQPIIFDLDLEIPKSQLTVVVGNTGSGKSTLLNLINGLVPTLTGGLFSGKIEIEGVNTTGKLPRNLAHIVGVVAQDPRNSFVTDMVEDELAYGMECLGFSKAVMRQRVDEVSNLLGLDSVLSRSLESLSAGQQQRVAIGSVLACNPKVLVLDEPTSALDPAAAEDVLASLQRLVHDLGLTIVIAEHRLERVLQFADNVISVPGNGKPIQIGSPAQIMKTAEIMSPIVELANSFGWSPIPLSVKDARAHTANLSLKLKGLNPPTSAKEELVEVASLRNASAAYGVLQALKNVSVSINSGEVLAVIGRNGAGKTTLLSTLVGTHLLNDGQVWVNNLQPNQIPKLNLVKEVGFVPQVPGDLLYAHSVLAECVQSDLDGKLVAGTTEKLLAKIAPGIDVFQDPRDLSEGQRLLLALTVVMSCAPKVLLLDEPTRGLDYSAKQALIKALRDLSFNGTAVVIASHDVELVAQIANRVLVLANGEVIATGNTRDILTSSVTFAPQVAKVLAPQTWLTVEEVKDALKIAG